MRRLARQKKLAARKRRKGRNRHHLTPRSRGGKNNQENILLIDIDRHDLWHRLWGNRTLEEVISLLSRLARMKGRTTKRYKAA